LKVLITGAGGNLGRVLAPALEKNGHEPILMDMRDIDTSYRFIKGDVSNQEDVNKAVEGVDAIVHAAALHGIHLAKYSRDEFMQLNVNGTYNVYQAAKNHNVKKVLLCSTIGVYGESVKVSDKGYAVVTENLPLLPVDFYGLSKTLCEKLAEFYNRTSEIQTIAYRLGNFIPDHFLQYGFRLMKGGVDDRDVAQAFLLGLENNSITFDSFNILPKVPFPMDEFYQLRNDSSKMVESYFPGITHLVEQRGEKIEKLLNYWGHVYWSIEKAEKLLGYQPKYNFPEFYSALKEVNDAHYPSANLPCWGL
jgi:UDP-glucose 4-epimerase